MFEYEEIKKEEAISYTKSIGASYHETSAKNSVGIDVKNFLYFIIFYRNYFTWLGWIY